MSARHSFFFALLCYLVALSLCEVTQDQNDGKGVMVWMCLERCGATPSTIDVMLAQIENNTDVITSVSFESYNLGPGSTLVKNNLTDVNTPLQQFGVQRFPMVSSYPYPPQFILYMREVFANPQPFIDQCISEAKTYNYTGYNIDWEPAVGGNSKDAVDYANFLTTFSDALHEHNLLVSVDCATWSPIWNLTLIGESSVDYVFDMSTYTNSDSSFLNQLQTAVSDVPLTKLGVGMQVTNDYTYEFMSEANIAWRLQQIEAENVQQIGIWRTPLLPFWFDLLRDWLQS